MRRVFATTLIGALLGSLLPLVAPAASLAQVDQTPLALPARGVEPVIMTGAQLGSWSGLPAQGSGHPLTGHRSPAPGTRVRDAHNGELVVPSGGATGVPVGDITAYRWEEGTGFIEIPVQVDERFPYFLANSRSGFAHYSGTDKELTYAWDVESWKKMFGECEARYANSIEEIQAGIAAGWVMPASTTEPEDFLAAMTDPVAELDHDDEVVFMASDAGGQAPSGAAPPGTSDERQEIRVVDPRDPANVSYVYLFLTDDGSSFDATNGYVDYERDANADEWIDRDTFADDDPEKLGSSNTGYGPNIPGTVCTEDRRDPIEQPPRATGDRFPRDGVTVSTDTYQWRATGRWMVRGMRITKPGTARDYGPDLIDRWKGRAFQQSPDSTISLVGFEDEQVNWEANSALLGERMGPVRAIRETWGADSGTNVTKTETFYRDSVHYRYRVRVHPIPPDGLYTSWDYNHDVAAVYYNETKGLTGGVPVDGRNDDVGNIDGVGDFPAYFDAPDPTFTKPLGTYNWEQVSGRDDAGSLVYMFEMKGATGASNPLVVPYYRDDACFDDGTGDDPSPRPWPGEPSDDPRVYPDDRPCFTEAEEGYAGPYRQGCFGCHGIHYFITHDTDNAMLSAEAVTEIDGAQWQWAVPTAEPTNVGDAYANTVKTPLVATSFVQRVEPRPQPTTSPSPSGSPDSTQDTTVSFTPDSAGSGQYSDGAIVAVQLEDEDGSPVVGAEVTFRLNGADGTGTWTATTDESGIAAQEITLTMRPGDYQLSAEYAGEQDRYAPSDAEMGFTIERENTVCVLTVSGPGNSRRFLTATLTDEDSGAAIAGRTIAFYGNGDLLGEADTDARGQATIEIPAGYRGKDVAYEATFAGDDYFIASSDTSP